MTGADGKRLEALVAFAERLHLPEGFTVNTNSKVVDEDGRQIAEFDIEIRGRVGTTDFSWLIECRDRPGSGAAPGSWIEQLVGRRTRFGFNKVTAVSTSGFATGAREFAREEGIELREARSLEPVAFSDWLQVMALKQILRVHDLKAASFLIDAAEPYRKKQAAIRAVNKAGDTEAILRRAVDGTPVKTEDAFVGAVAGIAECWADVAEGAAKEVSIRAEYPTEDHYVVPTELGGVKIAAIEFSGELRVDVREYPVASTTEYGQSGSSEVISEVVAFAPQKLHGIDLSFELHRMPATGMIHVIARKVS